MRTIAFFACLCCLVACTTNTRQDRFSNPKQAEFDSIVQSYYKRHYETHNGIVIKDLADEYKAKIDSFFDASKVENWELMLQGLEVKDKMIGDTLYKCVTFDLKNGLDIVPRITFKAMYLTKGESCDTDSTFIKLKGIGNLDKVRFSGFVVKYNDGYISNDPLNISYPDFTFVVKDITNTRKP